MALPEANPRCRRPPDLRTRNGRRSPRAAAAARRRVLARGPSEQDSAPDDPAGIGHGRRKPEQGSPNARHLSTSGPQVLAKGRAGRVQLRFNMMSTTVEVFGRAAGSSSEANDHLFNGFWSSGDLAQLLRISWLPRPEGQRQNGDTHLWKNSRSLRSSTGTPLRSRLTGYGKARRATGFGPQVTMLPKSSSSAGRRSPTSWRGSSSTRKWNSGPLTGWTAAALCAKYTSKAGISQITSASIGNLHSYKEERH